MGSKKGARCTICYHPNRKEIEGYIRSGEFLTDIAKTFDVSRFALANHRNTHMEFEEGKLPVAQVAGQQESSLKDTIIANTHHIEFSPTSVAVVPGRSIGKISDTTIDQFMPIKKVTEGKLPEVPIIQGKMPIDDAILDHKIEITKLQHKKELGVKFV